MKGRILCGVSAIAVTAVAGLWATSGFAATAQADQASQTTVTELVVIAQRRAQNIETVPVAITALSAKDRALKGISTLQDITDFTPGLSYTSIDDRPYIRGVGRNTDNLSTASAVATYYNGVYYGANAAIILQKDDLFIGNIEIDRGPQNTLHGSNSDGGTISYTSQRPTKSFYAEGRASVANYGEYMGEAVVSGPISQNVRIRLGAMYTDDSGGYFNNLNGPAQGGNISLGSSGAEHYLEGQIEANYGHLDLWGMVSSGESRANYYDTRTVGNIPTSLFMNGQFEPSGFYGLCGLPGVPSTPNGAGCAGGPTIVPGSVITGAVTADQFPGNNPGNVNPRDFIAGFTSTNDQTRNLALATNITYHFPSADLTYIGGFQTFNYMLNFNANGNGLTTESGVTSYQLAGPSAADAGTCEYFFPSNPAGCTQPLTINPNPNTTFFQEKDQFFSNELDLTSHSSSPLQYIFGLYQYHERYSQPVDAGVEPNQPQMTNPMYLSGTFLGTCPGGAVLCPAPQNAASAFSTSDTVITYDDFGAFGDLSYKFNDQWKISGAVRYTYDHKAGYQTWRFVAFDFVPGFTSDVLGANTPALDLTATQVPTTAYPGAGIPYFNAGNGAWYRDLSASWAAVTGEADIDWTPDPSTLLYFRYARGYKSGGFSTYTIGANPETQPEYLDSFELGGKKTVGSTFSLNGAAFYYNYQNDQIPLTVQTGGLLIPVLYNLPTVHTYGLELEGVWEPVRNLTFSLSYSYLHATISDAGGCIEDTVDPGATLAGANTNGCAQTPGAPVLQNINGQVLPEAPKNKISFNALYTIEFQPGSLTFSGSVIWKDVTYDSVFNRSYSRQPPYTLVNLRATWTDAKDRYNIIVFCNNVANTIGYDGAAGLLLSTSGPEDIISGYGLTAPRTYGVEFEYRFR